MNILIEGSLSFCILYKVGYKGTKKALGEGWFMIPKRKKWMGCFCSTSPLRFLKVGQAVKKVHAKPLQNFYVHLNFFCIKKGNINCFNPVYYFNVVSSSCTIYLILCHKRSSVSWSINHWCRQLQRNTPHFIWNKGLLWKGREGEWPAGSDQTQ